MLRSVFGKVVWDRRIGVWFWMLGLVGLAVLTVSFYPTIRDQSGFSEMLDSIPPELLAVFGVEDAMDMLTPVGLVNSRLYSSIGSILVVIYAISVGTQAIAGEEERRTMDLLLAQPVSRRRVVMQSFAAMAVLVSVLASGLVLVLVVTSPIFDLDLSVEGILAANVGMALLALVHGALALALGGLTGNRPLTVGVTAAVVVAGYFVNGLASVVEVLEPFRLFSPFHWFLAPNPLGSGVDWGSLGLMAAVAAGLAVAAAAAFDRRDIGG